MALTMDVFTPKDGKGLGVLWVINAAGRSSIERIDGPSFQKCSRILLARGYTVFAVVHSSAPASLCEAQFLDSQRLAPFAPAGLTAMSRYAIIMIAF